MTTLPAPLQAVQPLPSPEDLPSPTQAERAAALRRFNLLCVYLPVAMLFLAVLAVLSLLLWSTVGGAASFYARSLASSLADVIVILIVMPATLLCATLPLSFAGLVLYGRRQGWAPARRLQPLFWKAERALLRADRKLDELAPRLARPVISAHGWAAHLRTFLGHLKRILTWS